MFSNNKVTISQGWLDIKQGKSAREWTLSKWRPEDKESSRKGSLKD